MATNQTIRVKRTSGSSSPASGVFGELAFSAGDGVFYVHDNTSFVGFAKLNSPALTGTPTSTTAVFGTNNTQIATTAFVQNAFSGGIESIDWKDSVRITSSGSVADLSSITVADFDGQAQGVTLVEGDRVLIKDTASIDGVEALDSKRNGLYVVGTVTAGTAPLTRTEDANTDLKVTNGLTVSSTNEGANIGNRYLLTTADPIVLDTTALTFTEIPKQTVSEGDGINISAGDVISVDVDDLTGFGIENDTSNNFRLASTGFGNGLTGGSGVTVSINPDVTTGVTVAPVNLSANGVGVEVDNTSIEHITGRLEVKTIDGGVYV